jgi:hypothetical protein
LESKMQKDTSLTEKIAILAVNWVSLPFVPLNSLLLSQFKEM